jgi:Ni/Co efflux regulator RcnB
MKKLLIAGLALSVVSGAALPAAAADHDRRGRSEQRWDDRGDRRDDRRDRREDRREHRQDRREDRREFRQDAREDRREFRQHQRWVQAQRRYNAGVYHAPRGYQVRSWSYGQRMPSAYYGDRYVIRDYDRYGLYAPPPGYQWARNGNDAVLVAIAGGVIGAVVASLFF